MVEGWTLTAAAEAAGVSVRCARKWVGRYRLEGEPGLLDRSSAPRRVANRTRRGSGRGDREAARLRFTAAEIAETLGMALSTVSGILTRLGLGRLGRLGLEPASPLRALAAGRARPHRRQEARPDRGWRRQRVGGRASTTTPPHRPRRQPSRHVGWEYVHVASTTTAASPTPKCSPTRKPSPPSASSAAPSPSTAATASRSSASSPTTAAAYVLSHPRARLPTLGIRHLRTRPYRPQTNGKAERFIRTLLNGWAYGAIYRSSHERTAALDGWLWHYNHRRRHSALGHQPPVTRTNLLGSYT